jgi:nucleotide-binding universal stress UspA family protein
LKATVHPRTSFDIQTPNTHSAANTPYGSDDDDEIVDIKRAQKLGISMSAIDNLVPNRSIRTIVRGDYNGLQEEADHGRLRQRKYLVATDLSEESVYALEWTIGTILRDGDTMFALYVVHEDSNMSSGQVGEGAKAIQDANAVVRTQTREATQNTGGSRTILGRLGPGSTPRASTDMRTSPKAEAERVKAVEQVSNTCVKLLRKTLLQVRIAVEVIHCKNPKLLVTEAVSFGSHYSRIYPANYDQVDELEPTLVIVGARGQSALKG